MAIIKCKMCGGELELTEGLSVARCEFCGSRQTVPTADNEKKLNLFASANRLRAACEFDRAMGVYDTIRAEFPDEAEAYWGLVLCKYGIEYVDDPATGKKIPTCHRSSFDSILEDSDFEQALENADGSARKLYLEEGRHLEQIRKDILAVSSKESPYDVFICYKETDEKGDRTLDSQLAQQIYMALTDRGYRVFFARVTLKGALGAAYEPIIFAALNSARVMLAVGTCYEHFNAVWVKNEWSRFLKLMAGAKDKHLIPCFRDIDAYDMPREFRPLQAVDLGQMGAVQDIVLNMEKYIPLRKQAAPVVVQERVVVGGTAGDKIASLLDRGNMALEDGDWAKADSFFEDVLNNDSKNAQAYLGKTLAQEKCRTMDAFARKRKTASEHSDFEMLYLPVAVEHIREKVEACFVPNYVSRKDIERLYDFDVSYSSQASCRRTQYRNEETFWAEHKQLSRAEKFAVGAVAENLRREKGALFAVLAERIKQAEAAENSAKQEVLDRYTAHLREADAKAEALYAEGLARCEKEYQRLLQIAKNSSQVGSLYGAASGFGLMGDYQDSKALAEHCRKRADEEQAKIDAEIERQRIERERQAWEQKARSRRIGILMAIAAVIVIAVIVVMNTVVIPTRKYTQAESLLADGQYEEAFTAFDALGDYRDSTSSADYAAANLFIRCGETGDSSAESLLKAYEKNGNQGQQSATEVPEATEYYDIPVRRTHVARSAENTRMERYFAAAKNILQQLGTYRDSTALLQEIDSLKEAAYAQQYEQAEQYLHDGSYQEAASAFAAMGYYRDVRQKLDYIYALQLLEANYYSYAASEFESMNGYADSDVLADEANYRRLDALYSVFNQYGLEESYYAQDTYTDYCTVSFEKFCQVNPSFRLEDVDYENQSISFGGSSCYFYIISLGEELSFLTDYEARFGNSCELILYSATDNAIVQEMLNTVGFPGEPLMEQLQSGLAALGDYKDAATYLSDRTAERYEQAIALRESGDYTKALEIFLELEDYRDAPTQLLATYYAQGNALLEEEKYSKAVQAFRMAGEYEDAKEKVYVYQLTDCEVGSIILLGKYEQDNDLTNGAEEIEWIVIDKEGDQLLLLSKYCLDNRSFNNIKSNQWSSSSLRTWLNGTFYNSAFSAKEKNMIDSVYHEFYSNSYTTDRVFLLSQKEAQSCSDEVRQTTATAYAVAQGAKYSGNAAWWLRTQDYNIHYVKRVSIDGSIGGYGEVYNWSTNVKYSAMGVRPAIWITAS